MFPCQLQSLIMTHKFIESHLNSSLAEIQPHSKLLSCEDIRVLRLLEGAFELV